MRLVFVHGQIIGISAQQVVNLGRDGILRRCTVGLFVAPVSVLIGGPILKGHLRMAPRGEAVDL